MNDPAVKRGPGEPQTELEKELRLFAKAFHWSEHFVIIKPRPHVKGVNLIHEMRRWCVENIGPQLDINSTANDDHSNAVATGLGVTFSHIRTIREASNEPRGDFSRESERWLSAVAVGTIWPITYAFKFDHDAVHFKMRWYKP